MKVLIVNFTDIRGGAARAANRLHRSLLEEHIDSHMLVQLKFSNDINIHDAKKWYGKVIVKMKAISNNIRLTLNRIKTETPFSMSFAPTINVINRINKMNPDIVHLHWINAGMIHVKDLAKIKAPIVWSLHDSWAFTGGCHVRSDCENFMEACGNCPVLNQSKKRDLSSENWKQKNSSYRNIANLTVVGLSKWISKSAQNSSLLINKKVVNLPNP